MVIALEVYFQSIFCAFRLAAIDQRACKFYEFEHRNIVFNRLRSVKPLRFVLLAISASNGQAVLNFTYPAHSLPIALFASLMKIVSIFLADFCDAFCMKCVAFA